MTTMTQPTKLEPVLVDQVAMTGLQLTQVSVIEADAKVETKQQALNLLDKMNAARKTLLAHALAITSSMEQLVKRFGEDEQLEAAQIKVLEKFKVDVPTKKRLQDTRVNGLIYFTGLDSNLDESKALDFIKSYHKDLLDKVTKRVLDVALFEQAVKDGELKSETTAKFYKAPAPKAVCKVL